MTGEDPRVFTKKTRVKNDAEYVNGLLQLLQNFIDTTNTYITATENFAGFIRLDSDMKRFQKSLSRKISNQFGIPVIIEFKNSSQYRSIQFADLAVGIYRRE